MQAVTKLDKAKAQIVLDHPFFASILLRRKLVSDNTIPTLAVSDRGTIYYNEKFVDGLTVPQIVWGLCHEVGHVVGQHAVRLHGRKRRKWNYAGDAWINDMLKECGVGDPIPNTVDMPGSYTDTVDNIYNNLPDNDGDGGGEGDTRDDGGGGYMDGDGVGDDLRQEGGRPLTESEIKEIEGQIKIEIAEAAQAAKMRGKLPGALAKIVADILNVKTPWYELLEKYMVQHAKTDYTWMRPNRRFIPQGMYLPSIRSEAQMGCIVVQIDVSGSISRRELAYYNGHLARIVEQCKPEKVHVIYTDTQVQKHVEFQFGEEIQLEFYSGGGTHMPAGIDWVIEQGIEPAVFVCLTDGYTSFPENPSFPCIWCISSSLVAPDTAGETVHFEMESH